MKTMTTWAALLLCAGTMSAAAQTSAGGSSEKVGVIAFQTAVTQTNEFQRDFADLQKKYDPKRQELKTLSDTVETLKKQLQTQGDTLSDAEREKRAATINDKERDLKRAQEDAQGSFEQDMQQTFNSVATKVGDLLIGYAKEHEYTVVLDGGNPEAQLVLYANTSTDLTKTIVEAYNTKSGVPAQSAATTTRPAATHAAPAAKKPAAQH